MLASVTPDRDNYITQLARVTPNRDNYITLLSRVTPNRDNYINLLARVTPNRDNYTNLLARVTPNMDNYINLQTRERHRMLHYGQHMGPISGAHLQDMLPCKPERDTVCYIMGSIWAPSLVPIYKTCCRANQRGTLYFTLWAAYGYRL